MVWLVEKALMQKYFYLIYYQIYYNVTKLKELTSFIYINLYTCKKHDLKCLNYSLYVHRLGNPG